MDLVKIILILDVLLTILLLFQILSKKTNKANTLIFVMFLGIVIIAGFSINSASGSLRPIFYGIVIAYLFKPMCNVFYDKLLKLFRKKKPLDKAKKYAHILSIVCTYIVWFTIIYVFLALVLPRIAEALISFGSSLPSIFTYLFDLANRLSEENEFIRAILGDFLEEMQQDVTNFYNLISKYLQGLASGVLDAVIVSVTFIFNVIVGFIVSVYLLSGRKKFLGQSKFIIRGALGPKWSHLIFNEAKFADKMFSGYFVGSMIDSALVGIICYLACLAMRTPYAVLVALIVTVTNLIPFFGPYIGMIPSAIIILSKSPIHALMFVFMIWLLQQIDGNILAPKIIGSNTGLSSFWVLFAILLFGGLFGFIGMVIGVPVFAVIYDMIGKLIRFSLKTRGETDVIKEYETEFPSEPEEKDSAIDKIKTFFDNNVRKSNQDETNSAENTETIKNSNPSEIPENPDNSDDFTNENNVQCNPQQEFSEKSDKSVQTKVKIKRTQKIKDSKKKG